MKQISKISTLDRLPDKKERLLWRGAIRKEIRVMIKRGVGRHMKKRDIPPERRLVGSKWVFKIKNEGRYRAYHVVLRYSQVPGLDYLENFAPVINDVSLRVVLVLALQKVGFTETWMWKQVF